MSGLVNVRDHVDLVVNSDWAPSVAAAITAAVTDGKKGVFVQSAAADCTVRKPTPNSVDRPSAFTHWAVDY